MSVSILNKMYNSMPAIKIDTPENMVKKATSIAIPALLLYGSSFIQAEALGCVGCVVCLATGVSLPACAIPCAVCIVTTPVPLG